MLIPVEGVEGVNAHRKVRLLQTTVVNAQKLGVNFRTDREFVGRLKTSLLSIHSPRIVFATWFWAVTTRTPMGANLSRLP
jgi:hypothetical protein